MPLCITGGWIEKKKSRTAIDARIHHRGVDSLKGFLDVMFVSTFFIAAMGTWVTEKIVVPRLGDYEGDAEAEEIKPLSSDEYRGLWYSLASILVLTGLVLWGLIPENGFLREAETGSLLRSPFMIYAAKALVRTEFLDVGDDPDQIVSSFQERFFDTQKFFDPYAKGKFGRYLFKHHKDPVENPNQEQARQVIEEAQLFIEATHACEMRLTEAIQESIPVLTEAKPKRKPVKLPPGYKN